ncbi:hypothetical protein B0I27_110111 [Arcticibacter pallidicorallinus]|uniref:CHU domain-containing protein n=1 Tax=Arcticibacter pallidicorallinus TaxID=1259464 RepID=A0A2T0TW95_9SPHI|nr:lamin tail domain-containing protein [Arcticibacter pallidicorallinus]PRY49937.1 hypothetical protein B0I27_110111 [Arcticibacter pallidicorallinus]
MKKCLLLFTFFYWNFAIAQLKESFNDGNFTSSPVWAGDVTAFKVNSSGKLQTVKNDSASAKYLSTSLSLPAACSWEFSVELGFSPTSSNYVRVYLAAEKADLSGSLNGYFVEIGENGSKDSYDLYRQSGRNVQLLINGIDGRASASTLSTRILVNRAEDGSWQLYSKNRSESAFTLEGKADIPPEASSASWFGFQCVFTKSYSAQFYFDDIEIGAVKNPEIRPDPGIPADSSSTPGPGGSPAYSAIGKEEIIINEVLFNPRGDGADFVEIYNRSDKVFNLKHLSVATMKKDSVTSAKPITKSDILLYPASYMALSVDIGNIESEYDAPDRNALLQVQALPAFSNDKGIVLLVSDSTLIDRLDYSEDMHSPLIRDPDGVSLERSGFERGTNEPGNFCSAAGAVGYATPGYRNSQFRDTVTADEPVSLASKTFSPDNDGFEDQLIIHYSNSEPGLLANVSAYNGSGVLVRNICRNTTLSTEGDIFWDGTDENGKVAPVGVYIIFLELTDLSGKTRRYKKACVLASRF